MTFGPELGPVGPEGVLPGQTVEHVGAAQPVPDLTHEVVQMVRQQAVPVQEIGGTTGRVQFSHFSPVLSSAFNLIEMQVPKSTGYGMWVGNGSRLSLSTNGAPSCKEGAGNNAEFPSTIVPGETIGGSGEAIETGGTSDTTGSVSVGETIGETIGPVSVGETIGPVSVVSEDPLSVVSEGPVSVVSEGSVSVVSEGPVSVVSEGPVSVVSEGPESVGEISSDVSVVSEGPIVVVSFIFDGSTLPYQAQFFSSIAGSFSPLHA